MKLPEFLKKDADGFVHFAGHRIGLQHIVYYYNQGYSPEMLVSEYPALSLAVLHKTIAFYLENQAEIDRLIAESHDNLEQTRATAIRGPSLTELRQRLEAMRGAERT